MTSTIPTSIMAALRGIVRHAAGQASALFIICALALASCSSTSHLPQGEMLYTGIRKISYTDQEKHAARDTVGVITSIAETAKTASELLRGKGQGNGSAELAAEELAPDSKAARNARRADEHIVAQALHEAQTEVEAVLNYPPNYSILGSSSLRSPFRPGLWFYNSFVNSKSSFGKWVFKNFASKPVFISSVGPELRAKVANNTLHNYGFFRGRIDYEVMPAKNNKKAKVSYYITTKSLYRLDSIEYKGFMPVADSLIRAHWSERLLKKGDPFQVVKLDAEKKRLETLFRNNGFYFYDADYTTFRADTVMKKNKVQLQIMPVGNIPARVGHRYYIGHTNISMLSDMSDTIDNQFTRRNHTYRFHGHSVPVRPGVWLRSLLLRHGMAYNQDLDKLSLEKLSQMGIFSQINVSYSPRDTSATCDTLDINVFTQLDKRYTGELEMNVTSKSNDQIGPGIALGLTKKNAFRNGEDLSLRLYGSYEWQTHSTAGHDKSLLNSYELGASLDLKFPRLVLPFVQRRRLRFPSATTFSLTADWNERANYFNIVTFGVGVTYKWHRNRTSMHELTPFSLDYTQLVGKSHAFDSIMAVNPALYVSMRDQFIPSISYTYTYKSPESRRNPLWWQTTVKEAGNIVSAGYAAFGKRFNNKDKKLFGSPFAQYLKLTTELHKSWRLTNSLTLATRLMGGIIYSYGNSNSAPYKDQFYVGGANSVRAFTIRTVGPGRFHTDRSKFSYIDQTGDLKLEANAELRFPIWGSLNGAIFLDAGNVWLLRKDSQRPQGQLSGGGFLESLALGTGAGLRYDLEFIVLRLDLGVALHAPYDTGHGGYYNIGKFTDGLALHFAVGYPF